MIKYLKILATIGAIYSTTITATAQESDNAADYMSEVTRKAFELDDETWSYLKAVTRGKRASKVEDKRSVLVKAIKTAELSTARSKDYKGSSQFRDAIVNYLSLRYTVLKEDYDEILDMEEIAEQSYDGMEAYLLAKEKAGVKLDSAFQIMSKAQKNFAKQYDITLTDSRDKMTVQIRSAAETLNYYNDVYLIFFKSYKQEAYVLDAIERSDVGAIEQNNNTLKSFSEKGLTELKSMKSYKGDATLVAEAKKMIAFYQLESENEFSSISDFFLKKDKFEKMNKKMEDLSKKERTQDIISKFNTVVNEYNLASESFNSANQDAYNKRVKALNAWNKKVDYFISNHSK
ncbi:MAG: hypothetical protein ACJAQ2_001703 [Vicingaceae bacterium]|jgi:hypothetical protein